MKLLTFEKCRFTFRCSNMQTFCCPHLGVSMFFILSSPLSRLPKTFLLEVPPLLGVLSSGLLVGVTNHSEPFDVPDFTGVRFSSFKPRQELDIRKTRTDRFLIMFY